MKDIKAYQVGDPIAWKSHEGIKGNGSGIVIDAWLTDQDRYCITAKEGSRIVALGKTDIIGS